MIGQEPYHGSHGMAGEVGHLVVEEEGARCTCGNIGCLETVVSSSSILQRFRRRLSEGVISSLQNHRDDNGLTLEVIRDAAAAGDRLATSTLFELGTLLGDAVSKIIKLYNPRTLLIGGPVGVLGEHLREPMWIKVRQKVIPEMLVDLTVEIAPRTARRRGRGGRRLAERRFWKEARRAQHPRGIDAGIIAIFSRLRSFAPRIPTACPGKRRPTGWRMNLLVGPSTSRARFTSRSMSAKSRLLNAIELIPPTSVMDNESRSRTLSSESPFWTGSRGSTKYNTSTPASASPGPSVSTPVVIT